MNTTTVTTVTATLDLGDFRLTATGEYWDRNWTIRMVTGTPPFVIDRTWRVDRELIVDEDEVRELLWEEADAINRKYSTFTIEETEEEREEEDDE